jgi:hypothetical protein
MQYIKYEWLLYFLFFHSSSDKRATRRSGGDANAKRASTLLSEWTAEVDWWSKWENLRVFTRKLTFDQLILFVKEFAKQLQENEILYEEFVSNKPRTLSSQMPTTSARAKPAVSSRSPSGQSVESSLSDDYRPFESNRLREPTSGDTDFNLAKYLQDEEEVWHFFNSKKFN